MALGYAGMKKIDHYVGLPICLFLAMLYWFRNRLLGSAKRPDPPRRVLLIKFFGLGSIGYSTVIVEDLRRTFPGIHITLLTFAENRTFTEHLNMFDEIIGVDKSRLTRFFRDTIRNLARHLLFHPYDVCIDLEYFSKYSTIHTAFTRAPTRIGFYMKFNWRRFIYSHDAYFNTAKHVRRVYGMMAELAGANSSAEKPVCLSTTEASSTRVRRLLGTKAYGAPPFVGVNVNASDLALGRRWPAARYAELLTHLAQRGYHVFLTGAPSEREYTQSCLDLVDMTCRERLTNLAGELSILDFIAFLKEVSLFVSNDSGPVIFAILADVPSVSLWGPGDPDLYGGAEPLHSSVYSNYPCSPCMYIPSTDAGHYCGHTFPCIEAITTAQVLDVIDRRLGDQ